MTTAFSQATFTGAAKTPQLPTMPSGWPIASYDSYEDAQRAVGHLSTKDFPVQDVTIVGVEPLLVERITAKLTWGKVLGSGAMSGAWFGLFVGVLLSLFTPGAGLLPIVIGLASGLVFGVVFGAIGYGSARGKRDFVSHSQVVARRYDVLCQPRNAETGRDLLAKLAWQTGI
ncbi:hypothetical protein BAY61_06645 [Prauserella marina]|uniref:Uncharacterized protein n=1 Tax=Prauserella marina TaxID=530584 RepID=A0A222VLA7_9PSEU|nr:general stress protein [Prauserella marina]ASR34710.1 hypothetical protein BAY61_06645 [Prauserella marina]PWV85628.1 hypothetical protein DES30_1011656 [Prauserella marina]SDC50000.1 hypothetical protein SAMN05421630_102335 [Prauserella marina]